MKKLLFTLALVLGFGLAAYAQPRAMVFVLVVMSMHLININLAKI